MDCAFVAEVESWGCGGEMLDVIVLDDGQVVAITATCVAVYDDAAAFEAGEARGMIERQGGDADRRVTAVTAFRR